MSWIKDNCETKICYLFQIQLICIGDIVTYWSGENALHIIKYEINISMSTQTYIRKDSAGDSMLHTQVLLF